MPDDKKPDRIELSFPILRTGLKSTIGIKYNNRIDINGRDEADRTRKADSILTVLNTEVANDMKDIKLSGVKGQADSLISVYNSEGF